MKAFNDFAKNTKNDYIFIIFGLVIIVSSSLSKSVINPFIARFILFIGVVILAYAFLIVLKHIHTFFIVNPNFFIDNNYAPYRKNIMSGCGVCALLLFLIIYATYTVFF